jgi:stalled ribosome rescue protein Dom34
MSHATIWIDHHTAHIFEYTADGINEKVVKNDFHGKMDKEHQKKFYHQVAQELGAPKELFIVGPGTAKDEFKHHCEDHNHNNLKKAIVGVETMKEHPRQSEILAVSRKFFSKYYSWAGM